MVDRGQLEYYVERSGYKKKYLAQALDISTTSFRDKMAGRRDFKLGQAQRLAFLLDLSAEERERCFWPEKWV